MPTETIAPFDEVVIKLLVDGKEHILFHDYAIEASRSFCFVLEAYMRGELELHNEIRQTGIGQWWLAYQADIRTGNDLSSRYHVWSTTNEIGTETWIYTLSGIAYLEVTPYYPWMHEGSDNPSEYVPFEEYMQNYRPIAKIEIADDTVREWHRLCIDWLNSMDRMLEDKHYVS